MRGTTADNLIPLTAVRPGRRVRVIRIDGGRGMRGRLYAMGLTYGVSVKVICFDGGPVVLDVMGGRLMIGRGMATRIMVREVWGKSN